MSKKCFICCSQCFESNVDNQQKFFVANCHHVFCTGCLSQSKNICTICNKKCKLLPIDANLPKEVRNYFDPNAHINMLQNLIKIQEFQQAQAKAYVKKQYAHRKNYYQLKPKIQEAIKYKEKLFESMKREKAIMDRLKEAYRTNVITPDLFQMKSPYSQAMKTPNDVTISNADSPMSFSEPGSFVRIRRDSNDLTHTSSNLTRSNFSRSRDTVNIGHTQRSTQMKIGHKGLVRHTIHDIKQATQSRHSQLRGSQYKNIKYLIN